MEISYRYCRNHDERTGYDYYVRGTVYNGQDDSSIFYTSKGSRYIYKDLESEDLTVKDLYYILKNTTSKRKRKSVEIEINKTKDIKKQIDEPTKEETTENSYKNTNQNVNRTNPQYQSELDTQYKKLIFAKSSEERNIIKNNISKIEEKKYKFLDTKKEEEKHNINNQIVGEDSICEDSAYNYQLKTYYDNMKNAKTSTEANSANNKINSLNNRHEKDLNDKIKQDLKTEIGNVSNYNLENKNNIQGKFIRLTFAKTCSERQSIYKEIKDIQRQESAEKDRQHYDGYTSSIRQIKI